MKIDYNLVYRGKWEIIPNERNKTWIVKETFTVKTSFGDITIPKGFEHDRFTFAPDLKHSEVAAIVHDYLIEEKPRFDNGTFCTRKQADQILKELILKSKDYHWAYVYYYGVRFWAVFRGIDFKTPEEWEEIRRNKKQ